MGDDDGIRQDTLCSDPALCEFLLLQWPRRAADGYWSISISIGIYGSAKAHAENQCPVRPGGDLSDSWGYSTA